MRSSAFAALAVASLLLAACASGQVRLRTGQALAGAELAVAGANETARAAAESGACAGACAGKARRLLEGANACVGAAHAAYGRGEDAAAAIQLSSCFSRLAEAGAALDGGSR